MHLQASLIMWPLALVSIRSHPAVRWHKCALTLAEVFRGGLTCAQEKRGESHAPEPRVSPWTHVYASRGRWEGGRGREESLRNNSLQQKAAQVCTQFILAERPPIWNKTVVFRAPPPAITDTTRSVTHHPTTDYHHSRSRSWKKGKVWSPHPLK